MFLTIGNLVYLGNVVLETNVLNLVSYILQKAIIMLDYLDTNGLDILADIWAETWVAHWTNPVGGDSRSRSRDPLGPPWTPKPQK